jgi:hypothetical protein
MNLQEGRLLKVYRGGNHDVFHVVLPSQTGAEHKNYHIKYRYDTREFFDQEPCWHTEQDHCPAIDQFARET